MDLGDKLIMGTLLIGSGILLYGGAKATYHTNQVKKATTDFLDSFTSYLSQRTSKPEEIKSLAKFAKYRKKIGI